MPTLTSPYQNLVDKYKGLIGVDSLSSEDALALREFVNSRVRIAHERYPFPEFTIIGETINVGVGSQVVLKNISNFLSSDVTLNYPADIIYRIHKSHPRTQTIDDFGEEWNFTPIVSALGDLSAMIHKGSTNDIGSVYVTYRKELDHYINTPVGVTTGKFGLESGDNDEVPYSFSSYLAHGSYVDFLKSDGQASKAMQEEQTASVLLQQAIDKIQNQSRGFMNDIIEYRPTSQFARHNRSTGGQPINAGTTSDIQ